MPILGAHMSIAGGYYKAVEAAAKAGCDCVQVFTKKCLISSMMYTMITISICVLFFAGVAQGW